ncbi:MAG: hypothetical protein ABI626_06895 [Sphingomicrobium sp.]
MYVLENTVGEQFPTPGHGDVVRVSSSGTKTVVGGQLVQSHHISRIDIVRPIEDFPQLLYNFLARGPSLRRSFSLRHGTIFCSISIRA